MILFLKNLMYALTADFKRAPVTDWRAPLDATWNINNNQASKVWFYRKNLESLHFPPAEVLF